MTWSSKEGEDGKSMMEARKSKFDKLRLRLRSGSDEQARRYEHSHSQDLGGQREVDSRKNALVCEA